jgi:hypothetical protein
MPLPLLPNHHRGTNSRPVGFVVLPGSEKLPDRAQLHEDRVGHVLGHAASRWICSVKSTTDSASFDTSVTLGADSSCPPFTAIT